MVTKKCIAVSLSFLVLGAMLQGVVAPYTKADKKTFDDLVDVKFTKSALATKARKEERIKDLRTLAALMTRRLINLMDASGLKKIYNTNEILAIISPTISETKAELFNANRFATYEFEKNFEEAMETTFNSKLKDLNNRTEEWAHELKICLAVIENMVPKSETLSLLTFEEATQKLLMNKKTNTDLKNLTIKVKRVLRPTQEETIKILEESLAHFNTNYKKVITAIKQVTKETKDFLPDEMSLDYLKELAPAQKKN